METKESSLLKFIIVSKEYAALVLSILSTLLIYDKLALENMNHYFILGYMILLIALYAFFFYAIEFFLEENLRVETDYILVQGFLKTPIFILERYGRKVAIFRLENKRHAIFFKMEYQGVLPKGKYNEILIGTITIKPHQEYFIGATQKKYVYKKRSFTESITPEVIDSYDLKPIYCRAILKNKRFSLLDDDSHKKATIEINKF